MGPREKKKPLICHPFLATPLGEAGEKPKNWRGASPQPPGTPPLPGAVLGPPTLGGAPKGPCARPKGAQPKPGPKGKKRGPPRRGRGGGPPPGELAQISGDQGPGPPGGPPGLRGPPFHSHQGHGRKKVAPKGPVSENPGAPFSGEDGPPRKGGPVYFVSGPPRGAGPSRGRKGSLRY